METKENPTFEKQFRIVFSVTLYIHTLANIQMHSPKLMEILSADSFFFNFSNNIVRYPLTKMKFYIFYNPLVHRLQLRCHIWRIKYQLYPFPLDSKLWVCAGQLSTISAIFYVALLLISLVLPTIYQKFHPPFYFHTFEASSLKHLGFLLLAITKISNGILCITTVSFGSSCLLSSSSPSAKNHHYVTLLNYRIA